jgi:hypothetical protein
VTFKYQRNLPKRHAASDGGHDAWKKADEKVKQTSHACKAHRKYNRHTIYKMAKCNVVCVLCREDALESGRKALHLLTFGII